MNEVYLSWQHNWQGRIFLDEEYNFFNYISFYVWFMHAYQIMSKKKYNLKFFFQISINKTHGLYKHIANWKFPWLENNLVDNSLQWYHRQFRFDRNGPNNFWSSFYINYIRQLQKWYMYCNNWCKCIIIVLIKVPCPDNIPCPYYKFKKRHLNRKFCAALFHCLHTSYLFWGFWRVFLK